MLGVNVKAVAFICHEPGVAGDRVGSGEDFAGVAESVTVMGAFGDTPAVPGVGLTYETLRA
jgi:hypothetical protein